MATNYRIRTMRRDELDFAVKSAALEGWNPGLHDADAFFAADQGGFLVGLLDGTPIGCISAVRYGDNFGFIGFYIVTPEYRGRGHGRALWQAALEQLGTRNVGLDGVIEQQANYRRSGFRLACSNLRYEWRERSLVSAVSPTIIAAKDCPMEAIASFDCSCFPAARRAFLDAWLGLPDSRSLVWHEGGKLQGYGTIRRCQAGWKIGPLFADNREIAEALMLALSQEAASEESIYLDVPEIHADAMRLAEDFDMKEVFGTARMYNCHEPKIAQARVFGVTSFELG